MLIRTVWLAPVSMIIRIAAVLRLMARGLMKLLVVVPLMSNVPEPLPLLLFAAGMIEFGGAILVAIGLFTRVTAWLRRDEIAAAEGVERHNAWPAAIRGNLILLISLACFDALASAGPWSEIPGKHR
jgi:putative oxidoreductase